MSAPCAKKPALGSVIRDMHQALAQLKPRLNTPFKGILPAQAVRARELYLARRRRHEFLPEVADLFHEPVWDMLLDLFVAGQKGDYISVPSACIGSAVPSTTALRTLGVLKEREVIVIEPDPFDRRRRFVKLSPAVQQQMADYLAEI
ncbi:MarR family transcriptional regulator [Sphingomonas sp.]|uniref:MarR family transcriptional regulator n=1 Tax=Sphingomonas sp. TaxID=28214 RepID=UPI0033405DAA